VDQRSPQTYAGQSCHGHWCTPIPLQTLAFSPFTDNSLDSLSTLWQMEPDVSFIPEAAESWTHLTTKHVSTVFPSIWNELLSREQFCWVLPGPCGYNDHSGMTVSRAVLPGGSKVMCIRFQLWPLYNEIPSDSLNLLPILCTVDVEKNNVFCNLTQKLCLLCFVSPFEKTKPLVF